MISPGWYRHLWARFENDAPPSEAVAAWQSGAARLLREEGLPAATASVIEATRLATTLAAVRGLSVVGLAEMRDASLAALCHGDEVPLRLIENKLVIGNLVGVVDESVPQPPLQADLQRWQKRLRLKPEALERDIALDLRSTAGMAKSVLLHRLELIRVPWGKLVDASAGRGTFREIWRLEWAPELSVKLAEALVWGPTVEQAAAGAAVARATAQDDCALLAELVRHCLLADLGQSAQACIARLQAVAVDAANITGLMQAVSPLVDVLRYGAAREIPEQALRKLVLSLSVEICAGVRHACHGLDAEAALEVRGHLARFDRAVTLMEDAHVQSQWQGALAGIADDTQAASLLRGHAQRALYDRGVHDAQRTAASLSFALSPAQPPAQAGAWLEGFLGGSAEVLLVDDALHTIVDEWIAARSDDDFKEMLPLLRRAFSSFDASSRRRLLDRVRAGKAAQAVSVETSDPRAVDAFSKAAPLLATILGLDDVDAG